MFCLWRTWTVLLGDIFDKFKAVKEFSLNNPPIWMAVGYLEITHVKWYLKYTVNRQLSYILVYFQYEKCSDYLRFLEVCLLFEPLYQIDFRWIWLWRIWVLHLPFSTLICIEHLLVQLGDNLNGSFSLSQVSILVFSGKYHCCHVLLIDKRESIILLLEGISTFRCGAYPGQEQSFWWLGSLGSTPLLWKVCYNLLCWCGSQV